MPRAVRWREGALAGTVALAVVLLAGCGEDDDAGTTGGDLRTGSSTTTTAAVDEPVELDLPPGDQVVLEVSLRGGLCETGECWHTLAVRADGTWTSEAWDAAPSTGTVDPAVVEAMLAAFAAEPTTPADLPPAASCPADVDGSEEVFTVTLAAGAPLVFSTCEVAIPGDRSPFVEVMDVFRAANEAAEAARPQD